MIDQESNIHKKLIDFNKNNQNEFSNDEINQTQEYQSINKLKEDEESKFLSLNVYNNIMSSNVSLIHINALFLYIFSLISLSFLLFQIILISKVIQANYIVSYFEISMLISMTFFGISLGIVINYYYLNNNVSYKMKVVICSSITIFLVFFNVIANSLYLLYLCYPLISLVASIGFYSAKNYFEEYFNDQKYDDIKILLLSVFSLSFFLVFLNYFLLIKHWNYYLITFGVLNIIILIFGLCMSETPSYLFKNKDYRSLILQLERIKYKTIEEGEREVIYEELKKIDEVDGSAKVSNLFSNNLRNFSILYFIIICLNSYMTIAGMIISISYCYEIFYKPNKTFDELFVYIIISVCGPLFGVVFSNHTAIKRKILIIIHFAIMLGLAITILPLRRFTHVFGGIILFFSFSLYIILVKFGLEIYQGVFHKKIKIIFSFLFFATGVITAILVTALYAAHFNASVVSLLVFSLVGVVFSSFLNKDIE